MEGKVKELEEDNQRLREENTRLLKLTNKTEKTQYQPAVSKKRKRQSTILRIDELYTPPALPSQDLNLRSNPSHSNEIDSQITPSFTVNNTLMFILYFTPFKLFFLP